MATRPWLVVLGLIVAIYTTTMVQSAEKNSSWCFDDMIDNNTMSLMTQVINTAMGESYQKTEVENATDAKNQSSEDPCKAAVLDDMIVHEEQAAEWLKCLHKNRANRVRRSIYNFELLSAFKWTFPIPYRVAPSFSSTMKQAIVKALDDWASRTCVTFEELGPGETASHFVNFIGGSGCISFVGRIPNQPQPVFLNPTCFSSRVLTITHEVGHVLGFWHTHQRPGRSDHVSVDNENIIRNERDSFLELPPQLVANHTGYDYASLMHYDPYDLSVDIRGPKILTTVDPLYQNTIGQRVEISYLDAKAVNLAYCSENCANSALSPTCQNGGYQDPRDCGVCICPDGWSGNFCENLATSRGDTCGGELMATSSKQTVSSPRYELGNGYPRFQECTWRIRTEASRKIRFRFIEKLGIYCTPESFTCHDWVEIRFRLNDTDIGPRFCCDTPPPKTFTAETDDVMVIFRSRDSVSEPLERQGFKLEYFVDAVRCDPNLCQNGATCLTEGPTLCVCPTGFTGRTCATPIVDLCDRITCQNGGTCESYPNGTARCLCTANYKGRLCQLRVSRCDSNPCQGGAQCLQFGTIMCICPSNRTGVFCETEVSSPCESSPCRNNGTCLAGRRGYFCVCPTGYRGYQCERAPNPCETAGCVFGRCELRDGRPFCVCNPGSTGPRCSIDINECTSSPCRNGGRCLNLRNDYVCACPRYYRGKQCEIEIGGCSSNPCGQNGRCRVVGNAYRCICTAGWTGTNCQTRLTPCSSQPCRNGGTCASRPGSIVFSCACPTGFSGRTCNIVDPCSSQPCRNGGTCASHPGSIVFSCACSIGFSGRTCNIADPCSSQPCHNGGTCASRPGSIVFSCACSIGFSGRTCNIASPCSSQPCRNGGTCSSRPGSTLFSCACPNGFSGRTCSDVEEACSPSPCLGGGTCFPRRNTYFCVCPLGRGGARCERITNACGSNPCTQGTCMVLTDDRYICICEGGNPCDDDTDVCNRQPCLNGGSCTVRPGTTRRTCVCPRGFTGSSCENRPNSCSPNPCRNGGTCRVRGSSYQCMCPTGLSGRNCERGNCGACGERIGYICDPCVQRKAIRSTCTRTQVYYTRTSVLYIFTRRIRKTRTVYHTCNRLVSQFFCCDNAKMFFDSSGVRRCIMEGYQPFSTCSGRCGGCGTSTRKNFSVKTNRQGRGALIISSQTQPCNTAVCRRCSIADRIACICDVPCCTGFRQVGGQCVRNSP